MDFLWASITDWLRDVLVSGILSNLSGMFDGVNEKIGDIAGQVGATPQAWNSSIFNMVHSLSETVILPIAGVMLAFIMTLELIQMVTERNSLHDVDSWMFFRWIFKTACAILIVSNTWNIVMGAFDAAQEVVSRSAGTSGKGAGLSEDSHIYTGHGAGDQPPGCWLGVYGLGWRQAVDRNAPPCCRSLSSADEAAL